MPKGCFECSTCGAKCTREDGCYKHSQEGKAKRKEALKTYRQTENFKEKRKEYYEINEKPKRKINNKKTTQKEEFDETVADLNEIANVPTAGLRDVAIVEKPTEKEIEELIDDIDLSDDDSSHCSTCGESLTSESEEEK